MKTKQIVIALATVVGFLGFSLPVAVAESGQGPGGEGQAALADSLGTGFGASISSDFFSDYVFRGKNVYEGISIQPSATAFYSFGEVGALSLNLWMQLPGESSEPPEKFTELDTTVAYHVSYGKLNFATGNILYTFPSGEGRSDDTNEWFASVNADVLLHPSLSFYADYDAEKYQYYVLGFQEPLPVSAIGEGLEILPYVNFGFASNASDDSKAYSDNGLEHVDIGFAFNLNWGKIDITPNFHYSFESDDSASNEFWMGLRFGVSI